MIKKVLTSLILILIGGTFIFSGITKYLSLDIYEITLVKQHLATWGTTRFVARLIIAFEIALGILLIIHYKPKQLSKITIVLLAFFSALLGLQIITDTELENCFCFGETLQLTNTESILKNAVLLMLAFVVLKLEPLTSINRWKTILVSAIVFLTSLTTIVILYPPINIYKEYSIDTFKSGDDFPKIEGIPDEAYSGEVILAFMSPTCPHCKQAGMKLSMEKKKENSNYKIYPVFGFRKSRIKTFMEASELDIPYLIIEKKDFLKFTKGVFPQIYFLSDGKVQEILNKRKFIEKEL